MILATNRVEAARGYLAFGFAPVPIPARQKGPLMTGWQNFRATPADVATHFKGTGNLGILLGEASQGLTDVDLDCPETVELADVFLPVTGAEFGRPSKARSHRLYNSPAARTKRFKCPLTGATLVELRSDGGLQKGEGERAGGDEAENGRIADPLLSRLSSEAGGAAENKW